MCPIQEDYIETTWKEKVSSYVRAQANERRCYIRGVWPHSQMPSYSATSNIICGSTTATLC